MVHLDPLPTPGSLIPVTDLPKNLKKKEKEKPILYTNGHHLETWPFVWGHTNTNHRLFSACFMFVWPHVNSLTPRLLVDVRCRLRSLPWPFFLVSSLYFSTPSRVTLDPFFPGTLTDYPTDFGNGSRCVSLSRQYNIFSRWLSVPATDGQQ